MRNKLMKIGIATMAIWLFVSSMVFADAIEGERIVTLGENLSEEQRQSILSEMEVTEDSVDIITVSIEEERHYLGGHIDSSVIGSRSISSSMITVADEGSGINVETNNITWVSEGMYANALITAGVKDANVYVTAPFNVSGTGALTGLLKAYEITSDEAIPEEQKEVANEELVKTARLGEEYGVEQATELMARIKEAIAEQDIQSEEDLRELIQRLAGELGMTLTDTELDGLVSLFNRMRNLNIDWDQVQNQISNIRENLTDFLSSEEGQGFIRSILDFFSALIDSVKGWFSSSPGYVEPIDTALSSEVDIRKI
ncbi:MULTISPECIES: DUF1002 domain-containing protein [Bacillaceae]|uniref:DUF1002 domain-containing protein n=1 Tax=Evansella alkalicola TaxID=745819 RepID=A0ABS6JZ20_9BACI|nr:MULTISPECIES: DUF1002 domain-containing protein [Bacillaceae]MBU9722457.1 DUF1002 domain-containing protein [Bacillus alkalicola]